MTSERGTAVLPLSGRQTAVLFAGGVLVMLVLGVLCYLATKAFGVKKSDAAAYMTLLALLPSLGLLAWIYGWSMAKSRPRDPWLGLGRLGGGWALVGVLAGALSAAASWLVIALTRHWLGEPFNLFSDIMAASDRLTLPLIVVSLLVGVVLAPLWEEIAFRGVLYGWLRGRLPVAGSAVLAAVLHAGAHMDPAVMPALVVIFIWFGLLLEWSGNLWVPILAHATNNGLALLYVVWQMS